MWINDPSFNTLVRDVWTSHSNYAHVLDHFQKKALDWNKYTFGNLFARKKRTLARIHGIHKLDPEKQTLLQKLGILTAKRIFKYFKSRETFLATEIKN